MDWKRPFGACFSLTPCDCRSLGEQQRNGGSPIGLQIGSRDGDGDQREGQFKRSGRSGRRRRGAVQRGGPRRLLRPLPQPLLARTATPPPSPQPVARRPLSLLSRRIRPRLQPHDAPQRATGSGRATGTDVATALMSLFYTVLGVRSATTLR